MASYAGAYGAGGAADALQQLLAQRFEREQFDERRRQAQAEETFRQSEAAAARSREERRDVMAREDATERKRQFDTEQKRHADDARERRITHDMDSQKRSMERADEMEAGLEGERRQREFQAGENQKNRDFQSYMDNRRAARDRTSTGSEPLVAISDPATGQPRLVPRSDAVGARPASTREQVMTEGQSNASGFADRMKFNEDYIQRFEGEGTSRWAQLKGMLPAEMQGNGYQQYQSAKQNWIAANLRKESGAAIGKDEYANADRQYFRQPGESEAVAEQKRQLRAVAEAAMRRASGAGIVPGGTQGAGDVGGAPGGSGNQAPRMTRKIRNPATGETRMQTSLDGGATWN